MSYTKDVINSTQSEQLMAQIGDYIPPKPNNSEKSPKEIDNNTSQKKMDEVFVADRLSQESQSKLYDGIPEYTLKYEEKVRQYKQDHGVTGEEDRAEITDHTFFRKELIKLIAAKNASKDGKYSGDSKIRETNPDKATISMEKFLGKAGVELYKKALEEEMNSTEYMNAVFRTSTRHFEGQKWTQRPVVIVSGPSGSGKSFAAQAAVEKATELLPKKEGDHSGNDVVSVDGGVVREVSQMRKLVIQAANNKGYSGISDLHSKSSILEDAKDRMREAVLVTPAPDSGLPLLGVVIPETFSSNLNPARGPKLLKDIEKLEHTKPIFCRVDGEDSTLFQKVVTFMGTRRAWKTSNFPEDKDQNQPLPLDLNNTKIPESKAYGKKGFGFGQWGSKLAEMWFKRHSRDNLTMLITNDLVLLKEYPVGSQKWVNAQPDDDGAILISNRVFQSWKNGLAILSHDDLKVSPLGDHKLEFGPLINTSAEVDLAIAKEEIGMRKNIVENDLNDAKAKGTDPNLIAKLESKYEHLHILFQNIHIVGSKDKEGVQLLQEQMSRTIGEMEAHGEFGYFSKTKKALNHAVKALGKLSHELKDAEKVNQYQQGLRRELNVLRSPSSPDAIENLRATGPNIP